MKIHRSYVIIRTRKGVGSMKRFFFAIFCTLLGILAGYCYYTFYPCPTGTCVITSSVWSTMAYTGMIGLLVSYVLHQVKK